MKYLRVRLYCVFDTPIEEGFDDLLDELHRYGDTAILGAEVVGGIELPAAESDFNLLYKAVTK